MNNLFNSNVSGQLLSSRSRITPSIVSIIIAGTRKGQLDDGHLLELWPCIEIRACAEAI